MPRNQGIHEIENKLRAKCERRGYTSEHTEHFVRATLEKIRHQKQQKQQKQEIGTKQDA